MRAKPLTAGDAKVYRAPAAIVIIAVERVFQQTGTHLDTTVHVDATTTMLLGTHGSRPFDPGKVVRVVIGPAPAGASLVQVISTCQEAVNFMSSCELSGMLFAKLNELLMPRDTPGVSADQTPGDSGSVQHRAIVLNHLSPGHTIRIRGAPIGVLTGPYRGLTADSLPWASQPGRSPIPLSALDSIWVTKGHRSSGALIGSVVGVTAGFVIGCQQEPVQTIYGMDRCYHAGTYGLVGALGGVILGSVIGSAVPKWELRFP